MCEVVELSSRKKNSGCNKAKNMNTTSYYVDVSFFFSYRVQHKRAGAGVEQEPAEPIERQEMKH